MLLIIFQNGKYIKLTIHALVPIFALVFTSTEILKKMTDLTPVAIQGIVCACFVVVFLLPLTVEGIISGIVIGTHKQLHFYKADFRQICFNILIILLVATIIMLTFSIIFYIYIAAIVIAYAAYFEYSRRMFINTIYNNISTVSNMEMTIETIRNQAPTLYVTVECFSYDLKGRKVISYAVKVPLVITEWWDVSPSLYLPNFSFYWVQMRNMPILDQKSVNVVETVAKLLHAAYRGLDLNCVVGVELYIPGVHPESIISRKDKFPRYLNKTASHISTILMQGAFFYTKLKRSATLICYVSLRHIRVEDVDITINLRNMMVTFSFGTDVYQLPIYYPIDIASALSADVPLLNQYILDTSTPRDYPPSTGNDGAPLLPPPPVLHPETDIEVAPVAMNVGEHIGQSVSDKAPVDVPYVDKTSHPRFEDPEENSHSQFDAPLKAKASSVKKGKRTAGPRLRNKKPTVTDQYNESHWLLYEHGDDIENLADVDQAIEVLQNKYKNHEGNRYVNFGTSGKKNTVVKSRPQSGV